MVLRGPVWWPQDLLFSDDVVLLLSSDHELQRFLDPFTVAGMRISTIYQRRMERETDRWIGVASEVM